METLRSVSGWNAGYEGSNDAFFNLKGGGFSPDGVNFDELGDFATLVARFGNITTEDVYTNLQTGLAPLSGGKRQRLKIHLCRQLHSFTLQFDSLETFNKRKNEQ